MLASAVGRGGDAAANGVNFALGRDHGEMITRLRQGAKLVPRIGRGIVALVGSDREGIVDAAPADRMDFAVEYGDADRSARALHRRQRLPMVGGGIVAVDVADRAAMH